jgi:hypothetical protein
MQRNPAAWATFISSWIHQADVALGVRVHRATLAAAQSAQGCNF